MTVVWIAIAVQGFARLTRLGSNFTSLTVSVVLGLATTLGLQSTLSSIIAGILLFYDRILRLKDSVEFGPIKSKVVKLGMKNTWIRNDDGNMVVFSNSSPRTVR